MLMNCSIDQVLIILRNKVLAAANAVLSSVNTVPISGEILLLCFGTEFCKQI